MSSSISWLVGISALLLACGQDSSGELPPSDVSDAMADVAHGIPRRGRGHTGCPIDRGGVRLDSVSGEVLAEDVVLPPLDPRPSRSAAMEMTRAWSRAQRPSVRCITLPPAGSVPIASPPSAPFQRVPELEQLLNVPTFLYGNFTMISSVLAIDMNADGLGTSW